MSREQTLTEKVDKENGGDSNRQTIEVAHLSAIIDATEDAVVSKDLNGIIQSWNPGAERLFGYKPEEIIGQSILTIIPEDRQQEEDMILAKVRRGDKVENFQTVRQAKDGRLVDVAISVNPIRDNHGRIIGASKIARDLAPALEADEVNARLAAIVESSDDAIVSKNLNSVVQSWNRGAERLFGYLAEEIIGKKINILLPEDRQGEEAQILARLKQGERVDHFETIRVRKDGKPIHVSVTISPIRDRTGRIIGASKVARDISDRKLFEAATTAFTRELEDRVRERTSELESAHKEMEAFTYSVAHDLRAPLRAIISTSKILLEDHGGELSTDAQSLLHRQSVAAAHLGRLIDDLLTYSRLGRNVLKIADVDLSAMAELIVREYGDTAHEFVIEPGMKTKGDASLLRLLVQNLFDNALKFSPNGGTITFGQSSGTYFVKDEGVGFDMAFAEKVFRPFERLTTSAATPGTGIGLANAKRVVEKHGGSIWVTSVVNGGTTFYFRLPKEPPVSKHD